MKKRIFTKQMALVLSAAISTPLMQPYIVMAQSNIRYCEMLENVETTSDDAAIVTPDIGDQLIDTSSSGAINLDTRDDSDFKYNSQLVKLQ